MEVGKITGAEIAAKAIGSENSGADEQAKEVDKAQQADVSQKDGINTEEADRISAERAERASKAAVADYFRQQGLTESEVTEALEAYNAQKAAKREAEKNDLKALQDRVAGYEKQESETIRLANRRLVRAEAMTQAVGLGIRSDRVDHAIRLADLSQVEIDDQGHVDEASVRSALEKVLTEIPELKVTNSDDEGAHGFKVGSPGQKQVPGTSERIASIFGNTD